MKSNPIINLNSNFSNSSMIDSINPINYIKTHNCNIQNLKLSYYQTQPKYLIKSKNKIYQFNN